MSLLNITDAQSVVLKTLVFCGMSIVLMIVACIALIYKIQIDHALFDSTKDFVLLVGGIGGGTFLAQRMTDWRYKEIQGESAAKVAEATRPSAVSVTTPTTTVNTPTGT